MGGRVEESLQTIPYKPPSQQRNYRSVVSENRNAFFPRVLRERPLRQTRNLWHRPSLSVLARISSYTPVLETCTSCGGQHHLGK